MPYPSMLAGGITAHAGQDPFHLFAGDSKTVTGNGQAGASAIAQFTVLGRNALGRLVALADGHASGTLTIAAGNAVADETVTINGTAITWKAAGAAGPQVNIGASATLSAAALVAYITANSAALGVEASNVGGVVTIKALERGLTGNAITLAEAGTNTSVSGATLTGGDLDNVPEAKAVAIAAQPILADEYGPVYEGGFFNHEALIWPASLNTLAERKAVFDGTPINIGKLL